ncbi:HAD family hydrolase [Paenibacillus ginsengarvi]|uniref:HAD family hydrolase n=1 Tax=Paenibacillus ginsengarvi TaxID=400777 RepID=A0A3B0CJT4_9BACL|nr:HAD family hydrolase [Paenibacillus ginsengarvi]RKN85462.1 HAD family hydrolase [Paenibacillus ginsengarvi]
MRRFHPRNTKAVFFDMNNTLIDPKVSFDACFLHVLVDFAGRWDDGDGRWNPDNVLTTYKSEWKKEAPRLRGKPQLAEKAKQKCMEVALRHYPFQVNETFVSAFFREMRHQMRDRAVLYPQALETVGGLAGTYKVGVITNGSREHLERVLARVKLDDYIAGDRLFASDKSGIRKPNPAMFKAAARTVGVRPGEAVMVGDSWKNDISGAVKAGMNAVWLNRAGAGVKTGVRAGSTDVSVVSGFKELRELFET